MTVESVEAIPLAYDLEPGRGYGSARGTVTQRTTTLVRAETADGTVGWGEAWGPPRTVATLVDEVVADQVVGRTLTALQSLVEDTYAGLYHLAGRGLFQCAFSGVDIALWDLRGKRAGRPVHELLGGAQRETVTPYASTMYITDWGQDPAEPMASAVEEEFTAAKIKIGRGLEDDRERVRVAREHLGDDATLMVDVNGNYRADQAVRLAHELESFDVHWIEEPVPPEALDGYRTVSQEAGVTLAGGEAAYSRFDFERLVERGGVDVVQPDVTKVGGLSEGVVIARQATTAGAACSPHCWMGAVGLTAALHLAAVVPSYPHAGNVPDPFLFEIDRAENALRTDLVTDPMDPTDGTLGIPNDPGLGVTVDRQTVERLRVD